MVGAHFIQLGTGRGPALAELARMPAADGPDPLPWRAGTGRAADAVQCPGDAGHPGPVQLVVPGRARADGMDMPVDESGYHPPAAQVDDLASRRGEGRDLLVRAERRDPAARDRQRR